MIPWKMSVHAINRKKKKNHHHHQPNLYKDISQRLSLLYFTCIYHSVPGNARTQLHPILSLS